MKKYFALVLSILVFLISCSSSDQIRRSHRNTMNVPETDTTYRGDTSDYKFILHTSVNDRGVCTDIDIDVNAVPKTYSGYTNTQPPMRLTMEDTDCLKPFDVEVIRATFDDGEQRVFMHSEISEFKSRNGKLFFELNKFITEIGIVY